MQTEVGEVGLPVRLEVAIRSDLVLSCFGLHLAMLTWLLAFAEWYPLIILLQPDVSSLFLCAQYSIDVEGFLVLGFLVLPVLRCFCLGCSEGCDSKSISESQIHHFVLYLMCVWL